MSKLLSFIEFAVDVAAAYQEIHRPRKRQKIAGGDLLLAAAVLLMLTGLGFAIAAIYAALTVLGTVVACLLTAIAIFAIAGVCVAVSRHLLRSARE